ncbi:MAG: DUF5682 family protein [Sphingomonas sp.]
MSPRSPRELGCRDGNEVWDQLFETRIADAGWQGFFADVARYCACIRAATDPARMERDGTLAREAQMRAILAEVRAAVSGPIVAVVGGFHAGALFEPATGKPAAAEAGRSYLIRYGMRQLDALGGYGAGLPLPGFYDRLWQAREERAGRAWHWRWSAASRRISGRAAGRRRRPSPSSPTPSSRPSASPRCAGGPSPRATTSSTRSARASSRARFPSSRCRCSTRSRHGSPARRSARCRPRRDRRRWWRRCARRRGSLGFNVADGERRTRELDIYRKPRHRAASRFCHAMALVGANFSQRTAGPDFRNDVGLDRLHEIWSVGWSPLVEARLIELSEAADTLGEALAFALAQQLAELAGQGKGRSALAAIDLFSGRLPRPGWGRRPMPSSHWSRRR